VCFPHISQVRDIIILPYHKQISLSRVFKLPYKQGLCPGIFPNRDLFLSEKEKKVKPPAGLQGSRYSLAKNCILVYDSCMVEFPRKRLLLIVLTACLALAALSAEIFVFTHLDHDCIGENCSVCLQIETAQSLLKGLGFVIIAASLAGLSSGANLIVKKVAYCSAYLTSPIILNVKSNT
jgi:hypothetical protein